LIYLIFMATQAVSPRPRKAAGESGDARPVRLPTDRH
jgi:hypothetical protein